METLDVRFTLPSLQLIGVDVGDGDGRRQALRRLDTLLDRLERVHLAELEELPEGLVDELAESGLSQPDSFTVPELIEIVFNTQRPLMAANPNRRLVVDPEPEDEPRGGFAYWP